jgi:hypothetical protein
VLWCLGGKSSYTRKKKKGIFNIEKGKRIRKEEGWLGWQSVGNYYLLLH